MFSLSEFGIGGQATAAKISETGDTAYIVSGLSLVAVSLKSKSPTFLWTEDMEPHFTKGLISANKSFLSGLFSGTQKNFLFLPPCLSSCEKYLAVVAKSHNDSHSQILIFNISDGAPSRYVCSYNIAGGLITIRAQSGTSAFFGISSTLLVIATLAHDTYDFGLKEVSQILPSDSKQKVTATGLAVMGTTLMLSLDNSSSVILSTRTLSILKRINTEGQLHDVAAAFTLIDRVEHGAFLLMSILGNSRTPGAYTCLLYVVKRLRQGDSYHFVVGMFSFPLKTNKYSVDFQLLSYTYTRDGQFLNILFTGSNTNPFAVSVPTVFLHGAQETPGILPIFYDDPSRMDPNVKCDKLVLSAHISLTELAQAPKAVSELASSVAIFDPIFLDMLNCTDGPSGSATQAHTNTSMAALKDDQRVIRISAVLVLCDSIENTLFCTKSAHAASKLASLNYPGAMSVENSHAILIGAQCLKAPEEAKPSTNIYENSEFYSIAAVFSCLRYSQLYIVLERAIMRKEHREHITNAKLAHGAIGAILGTDPDYVFVFNNIRVLIHVCIIIIKNSLYLLNCLAKKLDSNADTEYEALAYLSKFLQPITYASARIVDTLLRVRKLDVSLGAEASTIRIIAETASSALGMMHYLTSIRSFINVPFPLSRNHSQKFSRIATILNYTKTKHLATCADASTVYGGVDSTAIIPTAARDDDNEVFFNCTVHAYSMMLRSLRKSVADESKSPNMLYTHEFGYYTVDETMKSIEGNPYRDIQDFSSVYAAHNMVGNTAIWSLVQFYTQLVLSGERPGVDYRKRRPGFTRMTIVDALKALLQEDINSSTSHSNSFSFETIDPRTALLKEAGIHGCRIFIVYALLVNGETPKACMDACMSLCFMGTDLRPFILQAAKISCGGDDGVLGYTDEKHSKAVEYYARCIYLSARILFAVDMGYCGPIDREIEDVSLSEDTIYLNQLMQVPGEGDFIGIQLLSSSMALSDTTRRSLRLLLFHALSYLPYAGAISTDAGFYTISRDDVEKSSKQWAGRLCHLSLLKGLISLARPLAFSSMEYSDGLHNTLLWPVHPGVARTELIMRSCIMSSVFISLTEPSPGIHSAEHKRIVETSINQQMSRAIYQLRRDFNGIVSNDTSFCSDRCLGLRLAYIFSELATNNYRIEEFYDELHLVSSLGSDVEPDMARSVLQETMRIVGRSNCRRRFDNMPSNTLDLEELTVDRESAANTSLGQSLRCLNELEETTDKRKATHGTVPIYCKLINYSPITKAEVSAITAFCLHHDEFYPYLLAFLISHDTKKALRFLQTLTVIDTDNKKNLDGLVYRITELEAKIPFCLRPINVNNEEVLSRTTGLSLSMRSGTLLAACQFSLDPQAHLPYNLTEEAIAANELYSTKNPMNRSFLTYTRLESHDPDEDECGLGAADVLYIPKYEEIEKQPLDATQPLFLLKRAGRSMGPIQTRQFGDGYNMQLQSDQPQGHAPIHGSEPLGYLFTEQPVALPQAQVPAKQYNKAVGIPIKRPPFKSAQRGVSVASVARQRPQPVNSYNAANTIQNNARTHPVQLQNPPPWQKPRASTPVDTKVSPVPPNQPHNWMFQSPIHVKSAVKQTSRFAAGAEPQPKKSVNFSNQMEEIQEDLNTITIGKGPKSSLAAQMNTAGMVLMNFPADKREKA
ncbi:hypothetical protein GL50803_007747 [Giardia duodenalis]|uniref:Uncharacterized protein n=1 Tax=Giardia intestinalis (strain ATCC 50803 / WB clone C6) TaxID=184922 RepID=A8B6T8_GIAIC|nr:hypothetical protein GL50803_007747 [Giardia intestinalis]KAE8301863.1 hypothetical protein GL50803_007747 [Giardia intestinalis]|eukprot:XP_001709052.1 Hypothetical protein GL50803_7747 [Giardia lamblia ATCC 50803]